MRWTSGLPNLASEIIIAVGADPARMDVGHSSPYPVASSDGHLNPVTAVTFILAGLSRCRAEAWSPNPATAVPWPLPQAVILSAPRNQSTTQAVNFHIDHLLLRRKPPSPAFILLPDGAEYRIKFPVVRFGPLCFKRAVTLYPSQLFVPTAGLSLFGSDAKPSRLVLPNGHHLPKPSTPHPPLPCPVLLLRRTG